MSQNRRPCSCEPRCVLKTEVHEGIEWEVPTWYKTPQEWNEYGAWLDEPETTARLLEGIKAAVPNWKELREASFAWNYQEEHQGPTCHTYWGSHGCSRRAGHEGLCVCGEPEDPCSAVLKLGTADTVLLWWNDDLEPCTHHWKWYP